LAAHKEQKRPSQKRVEDYKVWVNTDWKVVQGELVARPGRPAIKTHLFKVVAEKLPFGSLRNVKKILVDADIRLSGVYLAHDSMGVARYGGRGQIFDRLASHRRAYPKELVYFSFYIIQQRNHEREIENVILRAAGPQLLLNTKKIRHGIDPGAINDYEPRTYFFERQRLKGRKKKQGEIKA
jgi:hypothetical protein